MSTTPKSMGDFEVIKPLGKGGMGEVYLGRDPVLNRKVAIKVLSPQIASDREFLQRFLREAKIAAQLDHPHLVSIYSVGEKEGLPFLVMQFIEGQTLGEYLKKEGPVDYRRALEIIGQVAQALEAAHRKELIHRDIKPDNIMLDREGKVKVMDFGLARSSGEGHKITQTGCYLGTPEYSSPEQCETVHIDNRSDLYSLGVVLFEMLSGQVPHQAETPLKLFQKIVEETPPDIRQLNPDIPPSAVALLQKLLAKNPDERYQSAGKLLKDIERVLQGSPPAAVPASSSGNTTLATATDQLETQAERREETSIEKAVTRASAGLPPQRQRSKLPAIMAGLLGTALLIGMGIYLLRPLFSRLNPQGPIEKVDNPPSGQKDPDSGKKNNPEIEKSQNPDLTRDIPKNKNKGANQKSVRVGLIDFTQTPQGKAKKDSELEYMTLAISDILATKLSSVDYIEFIARETFQDMLASIDSKIGKASLSWRRKELRKKDIRFMLKGVFYRDTNSSHVFISVRIYDTHNKKGTVKSVSKTGAEENLFALVDEVAKMTQKELNSLMGRQSPPGPQPQGGQSYRASSDSLGFQGKTHGHSKDNLAQSRRKKTQRERTSDFFLFNNKLALAKKNPKKKTEANRDEEAGPKSPPQDNKKVAKKEKDHHESRENKREKEADVDQGNARVASRDNEEQNREKRRRPLLNFLRSFAKEKKEVANLKEEITPLIIARKIFQRIQEEKGERQSRRAAFELTRLLYKVKVKLKNGEKENAKALWQIYLQLEKETGAILQGKVKELRKEIAKKF